MLKGKTVVLGVTGGIAAYKSCELVRRLREGASPVEGAEVHVMMSRAAREFVTPLTFQTLSGNPVHTELFSLTEEMEIGHISLADRADIILIAPATADILAKISHGICDDLITTVICATKAPVILCPSMNVHMWENTITQENVQKLKRHGYLLMEPDEGSLACGYEGKGRLPNTQAVIELVERTLRALPLSLSK